MDKKFADRAYELFKDAYALYRKTLHLRIEVGVARDHGEYDVCPDIGFSFLESAEDSLYDAYSYLDVYSYLFTSSAL